jgi:hypothetical protein
MNYIIKVMSLNFNAWNKNPDSQKKYIFRR